MKTDAHDLIAEIFKTALRPPENMSVSDWADKNRYLSSKSSSEPGLWRTSRTPYLREIMDCLSSQSSVNEIVLMCGTQLGKTECGNNWLGYIIDVDPGPVMAIQPSLDLAKRYSQQRIVPLIANSPKLTQKVALNASRDESNTIMMKDFFGGTLVLSGANSAKSLRSMPVRYLFMDEIDAYPLDVDGEGDPVTLAEKRTSNFPNRKILKVSSPTVKGFSRIEAAYLASDQRQYHVPCPHCGEFQVLDFGLGENYGLKKHKDVVHYFCRHCGTAIEEHYKTQMLENGRWIARNPGENRAAGFHLPTLYSPLGWVSWQTIVDEFEKARNAERKGDNTLIKTFTNTVLAKTWEDTGDCVVEHELIKRCENYAMGTLPLGCLLLTAGVDVQPDRLHFLLWGWGRGEEAWLIDRRIIVGSPEEQSTWDELDLLLKTTWVHASGSQLLITSTAVDSGGHNTQAVYNYARIRANRHVLAIKGSSQVNRPILGKPSDIEINHRGTRIKSGVKLWPIGTDTAKALIYGRLRLTPPGAGCFHFPHSVPMDFFEQLTAERLVTRYIKGHPRYEWVKATGKRNEDLDCTVYAYAAALYAGINRWREVDWEKLEKRTHVQHEKFKAATFASEFENIKNASDDSKKNQNEIGQSVRRISRSRYLR